MSVREGDAPPASDVGVPVVFGLSVGFLLTGGLLVPNLAPYSVYLMCLIALSGGALLQGRLLDHRMAVELRDQRITSMGRVTVEDRAAGSPRAEVRVLLEEDRVRGGEVGGKPARSWERAILNALILGGDPPDPILYLGGGSRTLARGLIQAYPGLRITVSERNPALLELAAHHFGGGQELGGIRHLVGEPFAVLEAVGESQGLILVDTEAVPRLAGMPFLREGDWRQLRERSDAGGSVVLGGLCLPRGSPESTLSSMLRESRRFFPALGVHQTESQGSPQVLLPGACEHLEATLFLGDRLSLEWATHLPGFRLLDSQEG
jgi:hypothetical protein